MIEPLDRRRRGAASLRAVPTRRGAIDLHPAGYAVRRIGTAVHPRVVVAGEADCAVSAEITEAIRSALAEGPRRLTVDARAVSFADSSFLKVLLAAKAAAEAAGVRLMLRLDDDGAVARMFALTGLTGHFSLSRGPGRLI